MEQQKTKGEITGALVGEVVVNVLDTYWLIFAANTLISTNYPYDFKHIFAGYFVYMMIKKISKKIK
jgi:hypothetical protein